MERGKNAIGLAAVDRSLSAAIRYVANPIEVAVRALDGRLHDKGLALEVHQRLEFTRWRQLIDSSKTRTNPLLSAAVEVAAGAKRKTPERVRKRAGTEEVKVRVLA